MPHLLQACVSRPHDELLYGQCAAAETIRARNAAIRLVISRVFPAKYRIDTIECCAFLRILCSPPPPEKQLLLQIEGLVPPDDTRVIYARGDGEPKPLTAALLEHELRQAGVSGVSVYLPDHPDPAARASWAAVDA